VEGTGEFKDLSLIRPLIGGCAEDVVVKDEIGIDDIRKAIRIVITKNLAKAHTANYLMEIYKFFIKPECGRDSWIPSDPLYTFFKNIQNINRSSDAKLNNIDCNIIAI
jgi:hypothetical protein